MAFICNVPASLSYCFHSKLSISCDEVIPLGEYYILTGCRLEKYIIFKPFTGKIIFNILNCVSNENSKLMAGSKEEN
jgi:hypothetical protein